MPQSKRPRLTSSINDDAHHLPSANKLSGDVVAIIFSFLRPEDIMRLRRVCNKWRDAAKKTIVPPSMVVIATSFRTCLKCLNSCRQSIAASYSKLFEKRWSRELSYWSLAEDSPDWYDWYDEYESGSPKPPFELQLIQVGSRLGWSWCTDGKEHSCEINWLDPEPSNENSDYGDYIEELQCIERHRDFYRGYYQPPTEEEYRRLCEGS